MSTKRGTQHRTRRRPAPHDHPVAIQIAVCETSDIKRAQALTHDSLIRQLGDRRDGPVEWFVTTGREALERIDQLIMGEAAGYGPNHDSGTPGELLEYYRGARQRLLDWAPGSWLVIATAPAHL